MFANVFAHGRRAALAGVCSAGLVVAACAAGIASAGAATEQPQVQAQIRVPWSQVGPGWQLVEYTTGTPARHAATTLYLVSTGGVKYPVYSWSASARFAPGLVDWSGDKTRALLFSDTGQYEQLNLMTGKLTKITLPADVHLIGYTRPSGLNLLGTFVNASGTVSTVSRYSLTGKLTKVIDTQHFNGISAVDSADGVTVAVSAANGLRLVSNAGGVIRKLPVPGTDTHIGCNPIRWWNSGTILAGCFAPMKFETTRLWLVPANGATPTPLTPHHAAPDYGDIDAWRLSSGLYLQSLGACGTLVLNKENANCTVSKVNVPGTTNDNTRVVTADGQRLLIWSLTECPGTESLLWFNPGTHAEQWLFKAPAGSFGVLGVVPFYTRQNAPAM